MKIKLKLFVMTASQGINGFILNNAKTLALASTAVVTQSARIAAHQLIGVYKMSKIIKHAKNEMNLAWDKKNRYNKTLRKKTLSLLRTLSKQRNSSFLEEIVIGLFTKLARHRVLTPLTGKKKEWKGESKYKGIGHMHINKPTSNRFIAQ
ncbi:MAG: hypothetical protein H8E42_01380, partial [Nitrospinae bacterium]|nr:hypothetical protein [Nitrospinota bacterium]